VVLFLEVMGYCGLSWKTIIDNSALAILSEIPMKYSSSDFVTMISGYIRLEI
jgi:hypothetical protein